MCMCVVRMLQYNVVRRKKRNQPGRRRREGEHVRWLQRRLPGLRLGHVAVRRVATGGTGCVFRVSGRPTVSASQVSLATPLQRSPHLVLLAPLPPTIFTHFGSLPPPPPWPPSLNSAPPPPLLPLRDWFNVNPNSPPLHSTHPSLDFSVPPLQPLPARPASLPDRSWPSWTARLCRGRVWARRWTTWSS